MRLQERVILINGGADEVAASVARRLADEGAAVVYAGEDATRGAALVERIETDGGRAAYVQVRPEEEDSCQSVIADAVLSFGAIDGLVNMIDDPTRGDALEVSPEDWSSVVDRQLRGTWLVSRFALPFLRRGKAPAIVNVVASDALLTAPRRLLRATTQGGLMAMTRSLAIDYGPFDIRVNTICTGFIETTETKRRLDGAADPAAELSRIVEAHPLRRTGRPRDVACAAVFLLSEESRFITGSTLMVDGGRSIAAQDLLQ